MSPEKAPQQPENINSPEASSESKEEQSQQLIKDIRRSLLEEGDEAKAVKLLKELKELYTPQAKWEKGETILSFNERLDN